MIRFLSTPSARRATDQHQRSNAICNISIHALREEGDEMPIYSIPGIENFYPRPPRGGRRGLMLLSKKSLLHFYPRPPRGGRLGATIDRLHRAIFLSTPSARRATFDTLLLVPLCWDFYPRPPRGGRQETSRCYLADNVFLSTPSARRATFCAT